MNRPTILVTAGCRPEYIKLFPLILALKESRKFRVIFCSTGQHEELLQPTMQRIGVLPNINLVMLDSDSRTTNYVWADVLLNIEKTIKDIRPDIVVVQGDTATAAASTACAYNAGISIAHIEAGLRTHDIASPFPEEGNRQIISRLADINFCPTENAKENLLKENVQGKIYVVGNTEVDAVLYVLDNCEPIRTVDYDEFVLVTLHRRESIGKPLRDICAAIKKLSKDIPIVFPLHMNPQVREIVNQSLSDSSVALIEPFDFIDAAFAIARAKFIVTDSGGIQEGASALGVPVIVARDETDRPEAIGSGGAILGGRETEQLYSTMDLLLKNDLVCDKMSKADCPYGSGDSAKKICEILLRELYG